jgi:hypothetical protein
MLSKQSNHTKATGVNNDTTLLLGLDGLGAEWVEIDADGCPVVHLVTAAAEAARCPSCQVPSTSPKQRVTTRPRDLLTARNAYGFRNPANQRLRVRCATTRRARGHLKPA